MSGLLALFKQAFTGYNPDPPSFGNQRPCRTRTESPFRYAVERGGLRPVVTAASTHADTSNSFNAALNAAYDDVLPPPLTPYKPYQPPSDSRCRATVSWGARPAPNLDSSDEDVEAEELDAPEVPDDIWEQPAYIPIPRLAWTRGHPIVDTRLLRNLQANPTFSIELMKGTIDGTELIYLSKHWSLASRCLWRGFYSELKLYSSHKYLRNLQGIIVPRLINVYNSPTSFSLAFEPPHTSFWMEASADMPRVLKKAVIQAFIILHQQGIQHGDPQLRNVLIGGDGRVTLINFQAASARDPIPEVGLSPTDKGLLALEMRQVMFKLDYEGARAREYARQKRFVELEKRNKYLVSCGRPKETPTVDELEERPVNPAEWRTRWINALDSKPRRFVVPGQEPGELQRCIDSFNHMLVVMEGLDAKDMVSPLIYYGPYEWPSTPAFVTSAASSTSPDLVISSSSLPSHRPSTFTSQPNPRKRKGVDTEDSPDPAKRSRGENSNFKPTSLPAYERTSTTYETGTSQALLAAVPNSSAEVKPISVRDYAYEPYDGSRGYYVPDPPKEALRDTLRVVYIRNTNAIACGEQGLPYYRMDRSFIRGPSFKRSVPQGMHIALGALKRKRAAAENPMSPHERREAKRRCFEEDRAAHIAEHRAVRFEDELEVAMAGPQDPSGDANFKHGASPVEAEPAESSPPSVAGSTEPLRSALKQTSPVKCVNYDLTAWPPKSRGSTTPGAYTLPGPFFFLQGIISVPVQDAATEARRQPDTRDDEPGPALSAAASTNICAPAVLTGSSTVGHSETSRPDAARAALSAPLIPPGPSGLTHGRPSASTMSTETTPAVAESLPPASSFTEFMVRSQDPSAPAHDSRSGPRSGYGGDASLLCHPGSLPPSAERDLDDEMEVEAILFPKVGR
ncbi:hypothetical protein C8Q79DRAFT_1005044 [Trametes meyenii]|nr:hypothetical protein C8Q79DRAFT_1005044 [Trametes meyenii]